MPKKYPKLGNGIVNFLKKTPLILMLSLNLSGVLKAQEGYPSSEQTERGIDANEAYNKVRKVFTDCNEQYKDRYHEFLKQTGEIQHLDEDKLIQELKQHLEKKPATKGLIKKYEKAFPPEYFATDIEEKDSHYYYQVISVLAYDHGAFLDVEPEDKEDWTMFHFGDKGNFQGAPVLFLEKNSISALGTAAKPCIVMNPRGIHEQFTNLMQRDFIRKNYKKVILSEKDQWTFIKGKKGAFETYKERMKEKLIKGELNSEKLGESVLTHEGKHRENAQEYRRHIPMDGRLYYYPRHHEIISQISDGGFGFAERGELSAFAAGFRENPEFTLRYLLMGLLQDQNSPTYKLSYKLLAYIIQGEELKVLGPRSISAYFEEVQRVKKYYEEEGKGEQYLNESAFELTEMITKGITAESNILYIQRILDEITKVLEVAVRIDKCNSLLRTLKRNLEKGNEDMKNAYNLQKEVENLGNKIYEQSQLTKEDRTKLGEIEQQVDDLRNDTYKKK